MARERGNASQTAGVPGALCPGVPGLLLLCLALTAHKKNRDKVWVWRQERDPVHSNFFSGNSKLLLLISRALLRSFSLFDNVPCPSTLESVPFWKARVLWKLGWSESKKTGPQHSASCLLLFTHPASVF